MRRLMRRTATVCLLGILLWGCPGDLERPERFLDGGLSGDGGSCTDVEAQIFVPTCGTASCHVTPGPAGALDLVSPGTATRLATAVSTCQTKPMKTYLLEKVKGTQACGGPMPLGADPLTSAQITCLTNYLAKLGDGSL